MSFVSSPGSKEVTRGGEHFADATTPEWADFIAAACNVMHDKVMELTGDDEDELP